MQPLPWFKFSPDDWLLGDIQFCSDAAQLLFIKTCSLYWRNNCSLTIVELKKKSRLRLVKFNKTIEELINENILCVKNDKICIKFLDEQHAQRLARSEVNKLNGKLGGKANAKQTVSENEPNGKHIEEEEEDSKNRGEEEENDSQATTTASTFKFFLNKSCYIDKKDSEEVKWFTDCFKRFSEDFLKLCINACIDSRDRHGLNPRPCRSDLTLMMKKQNDKLKGLGVFREHDKGNT